MKKLLKWTIRIACILVGLTVSLLIAAFFVVNSASFQKRLLQRTTDILEDKLQTAVQIDSVSIDLLTLDAQLYRLCVEDRRQRKMFQVDYLQADVDIWPLLNHVLRISEAKVSGLRAELHHVPHDSIDSIANYQFVIDAFKKDKADDADHSPEAEKSKEHKKLAFIMKKFTADDIHVSYNNYVFSLDKLHYTQTRRKKTDIAVEQLSAKWERTNKKGWQVTNDATIGKLLLRNDRGHWLVDIGNLHFHNDNQHPRKNAGKPKRGFFDLEHINAYANLKADIDYVKGDSVHGRLTEFTARDTIMGIDIRNLHTTFSYTGRSRQTGKQLTSTGPTPRIALRDFVVRQVNTELRFDKGYIVLPSKKENRPLSYRTTTITGRTYLKDISRTFAPVLKTFTLPLNLSVRLSGNADTMTFRHIKVYTDDKRLTVAAHGNISNLKDKHRLRVHFDIDRMVAEDGIAETVIRQFPVKRFMMKQLNALGTLHYLGSFNVLWKKEEFQGNLGTQAGVLKFYFAIDENNKYLSGNASSEFLEIGQVMELKKIGPIAATATFKIDISKPRTAIMRKRLGGKLPIGEVHAHVSRASYDFITTKNLDVQIVSDGAIAEGSLKAPGKWMDLSCTFSFTNTNEMHKMSVKPAVKVHLFGKSGSRTEAEKAELAARRQQAKEEQDAIHAAKQQYKLEKKRLKEERRQTRADEQAAVKAAKQQRKAEEKQRKAEEKQRKAEEKAARKAEKAARKAANKP